MTATRCRWTLPYAAPPSERVSAIAPQRVLETAPGTGAVTRELACILPDNVSITATDLNEPMIALAQSNLGNGRILCGRPMHVTCLLEILSSTLWCANSA